MRRADRLFEIVQILRGRRLTTARYLAERLAVSERTIYRDVQDLSLSGVPVLGEAGIGYTLRKGFDVPPLMFDYEEVEALLIGARMAGAYGSKQLARSAERAMEKIAAVLPDNRRAALETTQVFVPDFHLDRQVAERFELLRQAIRARQFVHIDYVTEDKRESQRELRPVALHFWGERWTLAAWCELRQAFRMFRLDRMRELAPLDRQFRDEAGKTIADFLRQIGSEES
ncbi:MAG: YafY family transcriptional regulator [Burkholderiales bacterium]|nr:YafY family transcriptional regulator [Burkholderiales bacterium]